MADIDTTAPTLTGLILPTTFDVANGAHIAFAASAGDVGAGVDRIIVTLDRNYESGGVPASYLRFEDSTDSFSDGVSSLSALFDGASSTGTYSILSASVYDKVGNYRSYDTTQLQNAGIDTSFAVTNSAPDMTPPVITSFQVPATLNLNTRRTVNDEVHFSVNDPSGVRSLSLTFDQPISTSFITTGSHGYYNVITRSLSTINAKPIELGGYSGDFFFQHTGPDYILNIPINIHTADGHRTITSLTLADAAGNSTTLSGADLARAGYNVVTDFVADISAPMLTGLSIPHGPISSSVPSVNFSVSATDAGTGVSHAVMQLSSSTAQTNATLAQVVFSSPNELYPYDDFLDGMANQRVYVSDAAAGSYLISALSLFDFAGNSKTYSQAELVAGGFATEFRIGETTSGDFDGDRHSDILWQNSNGALSTWKVTGDIDGRQVTQGAFNFGLDPSWKAIETFDFSGDGRSDILFRHDDGRVAAWSATSFEGFNSNTYYRADAVPTSWRIAGAGDLNGDGKDDLIWQNADGQLSGWQSTGSAFQEAAYTRAAVATNWKVVGTGDFNGDGFSDLLWRSMDGGVSTWLNDSNHGFDEGSFYAANIPTSWHIVGAADFDGDAKDDLLWQNDDGRISVWHSNGSAFDQNAYSTIVAGNWRVAATGDYNGDGRADLIWQNNDGRVSTWQSNGAGFNEGVYNSAAPTSWHVAAHDFLL